MYFVLTVASINLNILSRIKLSNINVSSLKYLRSIQFLPMNNTSLITIYDRSPRLITVHGWQNNPDNVKHEYYTNSM